MEKHELIVGLVESFKKEGLELKDIIAAAQQFVTETENEIAALKQMSGKLNGFSMGVRPVSVSQDTLRLLRYQQFLIENKDELEKEWSK